MPVLLLAGTTASGKSALAIELAERHDAVVVSADAMTVYRGLDIGTAKPSQEEQERVKHYGIDVREPDEEFDVSAFVGIVNEAMAAHPRVIVAGGTTFWLSALVRPLAELPASIPEVRAKFEALENPHAALVSVDSEAAQRLHPNDRVRVVRALEVHTITGLTQSALHQKGPRHPPLEATVAWMNHEDIYERINRRTLQMADEGYIAEVQSLLRDGHSRECKPLKAFAYRHIVEHCLDGLDIDEALRRTARDTRHYAKKQRNWARNLMWESSDPDSVRATAESLFSGT
jgi:tRNA dimethylallyltransferase